MLFLNLHIGDWLKSTMHLSESERGVYLTLLLRYYDTEKPLPSDKEAIYRLACVRNADAMRAVDVVLDEFFVYGPDGWRNKRADAEIAKYQAKCEKARSSSKSRWDKEKNEEKPHQKDDDADGMRTHCEGNANQKPKYHSSLSVSGEPDPVAAEAATACRRLRAECGLMQTNPTDPRLLDAIRGGATADMLVGLAGEYPGKGVPYLAKAAIGRINDANQDGGAHGSQTAAGVSRRHPNGNRKQSVIEQSDELTRQFLAQHAGGA